jgi:hypothetical protein
MAKKAKKIVVVHGTEENFYEGEVLGKFATKEEAMQCARENLCEILADEGGLEGKELEDAVEDCLGTGTDFNDDLDTLDYCDFRHAFYVGTDAEERMEELRDEQLREHFPEEFDEEE